MFFKKYFLLLKENSHVPLIILIFLGILVGVSSIALMAIINSVIDLDPNNETFYLNLFIGFLATFGVHFIVQTIYQISLIKISYRTIWQLRINTLQNVRRSDYLKYQSYGNNKIHTILTRDANELSKFNQTFSNIVVASVTLIAGFIYLFWISPIGALLSMGLSVLVVMAHFLNRKKAKDKQTEAREVENQFNKYFLSVLEGIKELKIDSKKSDDLFENHLIKSGLKAQSLWSEVSVLFYYNGLIGNYFIYVLLILLLFVLPFFNISILNNSFEYILISLYLMKPTQVIVGSIPSFSFANRAIDHFNELKGLKESREVEANGGRQISELEEVNFNKLVFQYEYEKDNFKIGPIDLILTKGQIVFLSGGNGSGKSTFIKLLTGLYSPKSGDVMVNNEKISNIQSDYYRSLFSVIYTDSYLFDVVLGFEGNQDEKMNGILAKLGISSKVKCKDNILSTIDLSYGQRKRVNLAICLLEDKPIYIFDEVAANQDSKFKAYFYTNVLQELKEKGKIVFVVTHDDKYFHLADQHFKMDEGKIHSYNITNNR